MGVARMRDDLRCADAAPRLGLLADGELRDEWEMSELRGHVATCPACQSAWQRLMGGKRALQLVADVEVAPAGLLDAVDAFTTADVAAEQQLFVRRLARRLVVVVVAAAALAGALAAVNS